MKNNKIEEIKKEFIEICRDGGFAMENDPYDWDLSDFYDENKISDWWLQKLDALLEEQKQEIINKIEKHNNIIKERLQYCSNQNGLDYCKNCGLNEEDIIKPISKK